MKRFYIHQVKEGNFQILTKNHGDIDVMMEGHIDMDFPQSVLDPYFNQVHQLAMDQGIKKVNCFVKDLQFINSSGIRCFAAWILKNKRLDEKQRYHISICYDKDSPWQIGTFRNLSMLAIDSVLLQSA